MNVITMGAHILDVLVRPVSEIPPGQGTVLVEQMRMTAAGTAAGTALTFAKLGAAVHTVGAIGTDPAGDVLLSLLGSAGIDTSLVVRKPDVPTSMSVLPIRPNGERPSLHLLGANLAYTLDDVNWDAVASTDHIHLGGVELLGPDITTRILRHAKENGVTTSVDLIAPGGMGTFDIIQPAMAYTDYLLPNEDQVLGFTGAADLADGCRDSLMRAPGCSPSPAVPTARSSSAAKVLNRFRRSPSTSLTPPAAATPSRQASFMPPVSAGCHATPRSWATRSPHSSPADWAAITAISTSQPPTRSPRARRIASN
jgi:sugar/nucleoside kinase (ribokinase family)